MDHWGICPNDRRADMSAGEAAKPFDFTQPLVALISALPPLAAKVLLQAGVGSIVVYAFCVGGVLFFGTILLVWRGRLGIFARSAMGFSGAALVYFALTVALADLEAKKARAMAQTTAAPPAVVAPAQAAPPPAVVVPAPVTIPRKRKPGEEGFALFNEPYAEGTNAVIPHGSGPLAPSRDLQIDRLPAKKPAAKPSEFAVFREGGTQPDRRSNDSQKGTSR